MLQSGSLQVPSTGTGRSRFSKALPAIPGLDTSHVEESRAFPSSTTSPTAALPTPATPLRSPGDSELPPPPPPPHNDDPRTPIQFTPLPPIPKKRIATATPGPAPTEATAPATPATGLPKMMIPRRPVGSTKHTARKPSITSPVNQGVISGQTQVQVPAQEQPASAPAPPAQQQQQTPPNRYHLRKQANLQPNSARRGPSRYRDPKLGVQESGSRRRRATRPRRRMRNLK
ncbi:hypothetical protein V2G26_013847 [Clonostachys chloroleuca]